MVCGGSYKGNAVIVALFAVTTLMILGSAFLSSVNFDIKNAAWEKYKVQAIYLAEAGLNRAVKALKSDADWTDNNGATKNSDYKNEDGWYYLFDGGNVEDVPLVVGTYTVMLRNVRDQNGEVIPNRIEIRSIGKAGPQRHEIRVRLTAGRANTRAGQAAYRGIEEAVDSLLDDSSWSDNLGATSNMDNQDKYQGDWYPLYDEDRGGDAVDVPVNDEGGQRIGTYTALLRNTLDEEGNLDANEIEAKSIGESGSEWAEERARLIRVGKEISGKGADELEGQLEAIYSAMVGLNEAIESLWEDSDWSDSSGATANSDDYDKRDDDWYPLYDDETGGDAVDVPVYDESGARIGNYTVMLRNATDEEGSIEGDVIEVKVTGQTSSYSHSMHMLLNRNDIIEMGREITRAAWEELKEVIRELEADSDWSDSSGATSNKDDLDKYKGDWYPMFDEEAGRDVVDIPVYDEEGERIGSYTVMLRNVVDQSGEEDSNAIDVKLICGSDSQKQIILMRLMREVEVNLFRWALFGGERVNLHGSVETDSYDSRIGAYWEQTPGENGHVGSNGDIKVTGSAEICGDARPGPGHAVRITGAALVTGSTDPLPEEVILPPLEEFEVGSQDLKETGSSRVTFTEGTYYYDEIRLTGSSQMIIDGNVTIYCRSFTQTGSAQIIIESGGKLVMYCKDDFKLAGSGLMNQTGVPLNFQLYSTARSEEGEEVKLTGGSEFCGVVYAPYGDADVTGDHRFYGSIVVGGKVHGTGNTEYHYDESLAEERSLTIKTLVVTVTERTVQEASRQEVM